MSCGIDVSDVDKQPLLVDGQEIEYGTLFVYLGCLMTPDGRVGAEIDCHLAAASRAFGCLRCIFNDANLSLQSKCMVYTACVISLLLYGAECWPILRRDEVRMDSFHHQCLRTIFGITQWDQELQHITNTDLRQRWGDVSLMSDILRRRRLQWLGHVARMPITRLPKKLLFGWLSQTRPAQGPRLRWKDWIQADLKLLKLEGWYDLAQQRSEWQTLCQTEATHTPKKLSFSCTVCYRSFRSHSGMKRHKCLMKRQLPLCEQPGAVQCAKCHRWLRSVGGLAIHKCLNVSSSPPLTALSLPDSSTWSSSPSSLVSTDCASRRIPVPGRTCCCCHCSLCGRCFKSKPGFQRHNCHRGKRRPKNDYSQLPLSCTCGRHFRWLRDMKRHKC